MLYVDDVIKNDRINIVYNPLDLVQVTYVNGGARFFYGSEEVLYTFLLKIQTISYNVENLASVKVNIYCLTLFSTLFPHNIPSCSTIRIIYTFSEYAWMFWGVYVLVVFICVMFLLNLVAQTFTKSLSM